MKVMTSIICGRKYMTTRCSDLKRGLVFTTDLFALVEMPSLLEKVPDLRWMFLVFIMPILAPGIFPLHFCRVQQLLYCLLLASHIRSSAVKRIEKTQTNNQQLYHSVITIILFVFPDCQERSFQSIAQLDYLRNFLDTFPLKGFKMRWQLSVPRKASAF